MRAIALVIVATMLVFFVLLSVKLLDAIGDARDFVQVGRAIVGVPMLLCALVAWWLRKGRPRAMRPLRRVEVVLIAGFSTWVAFWMGGAFPSLVPLLDQAPLDLGLSQAAWMSLMIVAYGLLIPNRWQRTAWMIAFMLGEVALVDAWILSQYPIPTVVAATFFGAQWSLLLGFTAYAVFGAYRIEAITMRRISSSIAVSMLATSLVSCGPLLDPCGNEQKVPILLTVVDAADPNLQLPAVAVTLREGSYSEQQSSAQETRPPLLFGLGPPRAGTYELTVTAQGYVPAVLRGVQVVTDRCDNAVVIKPIVRLTRTP